MGQLDASIVTLALPRLGRDLHAGVGAVEWVALAYLLVLVGTVTVVGRISDAAGRKLVYMYGFAVFTAGSVVCGLAPSLPLLIGARVLQALGAAMLQANSVALITEAMPRPLLARGIGVQGAAQALGLALGPAIGGLLLATGGWRSIFLVNLPIGAIGIALGWFLLPRSRSRRRLAGADRLGAALLALSVAGPLLYLSLAGRQGYGDLLLLAALALGLLAAICFARREQRISSPLIDLSLFRRRALARGLAAGFISYVILFGTLFAVPYYLSSNGVPALLIGLELSALPLAIAIAAPIAGRHMSSVGDRVLTSAGLVVAAGGLLEIGLWHGTLGLILGLVLAGIGLGVFIPANNASVMAASPTGHAGTVGGVLNMARGIGIALGVALTGAIYTALTHSGGTVSNQGAAGQGITVALTALGVLALATGAAQLRRPRHI